MLRHLHIRNLAVVAEASIDFGPGFNVLTGETGAGKSIVVDSLALLAGARASNELIRTGAATLTVSGVFEGGAESWRPALEEVGVEAEGEELMVRREIARGGRNRVFVNDQPVTLKLLSSLAPALLRIHGQREELGLVAPDLQRAWLDRLGGAKGEKLLERTARAFGTYRELAERLERLSGDVRARREKIDFLRFQLREIDAAEPRAGEEEELARERRVLANSEAIREALGLSAALLSEEEGSAAERLAKSRQALERVRAWEPGAEAWAAELEEIGIRLDEVHLGLQRRLSAVESDPGRLDAIESRLAVLERLFHKYGADSAEVLARRAELAAELESLEGAEDSREELAMKISDALETYRRAAARLSTAREKYRATLERRVAAELAELSLEKARFEVALERRRRAGSPLELDGEGVEFGPLGWDRVVFLFSPNPGEELRSLAKVASGGELSRLYLAVQLATQPESGQRGGESGPGLVFDEVDSGIGGAEAAALGAKLRRLARGGQILAVTHLPQVASYGHEQYKVGKRVERDRTLTSVDRLQEDARAEELARMLGGSETTELTLRHARELLSKAEA